MQIRIIDFFRIAVGEYHNCALGGAGFVYCWGNDFTGQIGSGFRVVADCRDPLLPPKTCVPAPTHISRPPAIAKVFIDIDAGRGHNCAKDRSQIVYCWGSGQFGELGALPLLSTCGTSSSALCFRRSLLPIQVATGISAQMVDVSARLISACAVTVTGRVLCWGGVGKTSTPVVMGSPGVTYTKIGTGDDFACAGLLDGTVQCLGENTYGQLGNGTNAPSTTPVVVSSALSSALSLGWSFACSVNAGSVQCWGKNDQGQLGDGTTNSSNVPVLASGGSGFIAARVGVGMGHSCAISAAGNVRCWGRNVNGQLGNGTATTVPGNLPSDVAAGWVIQ